MNCIVIFNKFCLLLIKGGYIMKVKVDYSEILNTDDLLITCHPDHTNIDENLKFKIYS